MRILHIVPESLMVPQLYYLGSTKDMLGRIEYFDARSFEVDRLVVERADKVLLERLHQIDLMLYDTVFVELPIYPTSIAYIRKTSPKTKVFCRSINAELYHQLDAFFSNYKYQRRYGKSVYTSFIENINLLRGAYYRFKQDYKCGNISNIVFSITDWEKKYYWNYLAGSAARSLPYYLPAIYEEEIKSNTGYKENVCVSFMGVSIGAGSFLADSLYNFNVLVKKLKQDLPDWSFMVTSDTTEISQDFYLTERIITTGFMKTPYPLLSRAKAIAILSHYGYGFKTKILEAILSGCYVLVPRSLKRRLPNAVKPFCIEVKLDSISSFKEALMQSQTPLSGDNPNTELRMEAFHALDSVFINK